MDTWGTCSQNQPATNWRPSVRNSRHFQLWYRLHTSRVCAEHNMQPTLLLLRKTQLQDGNWQIIAKRVPPSGRPAGERERERRHTTWLALLSTRLVLLLHRSKCLLWNISIIPVVFGSEQDCVSIYSNTSFLLLMQLLHSVWVPERCSCQWKGAERACNCSSRSELLFLQRRRCEKGKWQQMCTAVCRDIWWREKSNLSVYTGDAF